MRHFNAVRLAVIGLLTMVCSYSANAQTKVTIGTAGAFTDAGFYLADALGFFKEEKLDVTLQRMPASAAVTAGLATNSLDVGGLGLSPGLYAAFDRGINIRLVGDKQSAKPGFSASHLVVAKRLWKGSREDTIRSLKGTKLAIGTKGSSTYKNLLGVLNKYDLTDKDVVIIEMAFAQMSAALKSGAIDGGIFIEPAVTLVTKSGDGQSASDLLEVKTGGGASTVPLVYSEKFLKNSEAAQGFMNAYMKGVRVYNDAFLKNKDTEKTIAILAKYTGLDADIIRDMNKANLDPNQNFSVEAIAEMQDFFFDQGFLKSKVDVSKMVDTSFAESAVKKLGEYKE